MSDAQKFEIQGTVNGFPQKKKGDKGVYWNVETSVGKVNIRQDDEPQFQEGKVYKFSGLVSEFQSNGETRKMKWVNEFGIVGETTTVNSHQKEHLSGPPSVPVKEQLNGMALGNRLTNATAIVVAQIEKGSVKSDNDSIEKALQYWNEVFERYQATGKIEAIPF